MPLVIALESAVCVAGFLYIVLCMQRLKGIALNYSTRARLSRSQYDCRPLVNAHRYQSRCRNRCFLLCVVAMGVHCVGDPECTAKNSPWSLTRSQLGVLILSIVESAATASIVLAGIVVRFLVERYCDAPQPFVLMSSLRDCKFASGRNAWLEMYSL